MTNWNDCDSTAAIGFARLHNEKAKFYESLGAMAADLRNKKEIQQDVDTTISESKIEVRGTNGMEWELRLKDKGEGTRAFNAHAFNQFSYLIGFPPRTLTKCPKNLAEQNVNHFAFIEGGKKVKYRLEGDRVRAVVSDKYVGVDHLEIIDRLQQANSKLEVNFAGVSEKRMVALILDPDSKFEGPDGSVLSHATVVGNSETGEGTFFGRDLWYDWICENRNIWGSKIRSGVFSRKHVGDVRRGLDEMFDWLHVDRKHNIEYAKERLHKSAVDIISDKDEKVVDYLRKEGITKAIATQSVAIVRNRWPDGGEVSRFQLGSGVTKAAQSLNMDARLELEVQASQLSFV